MGCKMARLIIQKQRWTLLKKGINPPWAMYTYTDDQNNVR